MISNFMVIEAFYRIDVSLHSFAVPLMFTNCSCHILPFKESRANIVLLFQGDKQ